MKNLLLAFLAVAAIGFTSCGSDDDCKTCEINVLLFSVTSEICQDGDNVITTTEGVSDTTFNASVSDVVSGLEAAGGDCN